MVTRKKVVATKVVPVQEKVEVAPDVVRAEVDRPQRKSRQPFGSPRSKLSVSRLIPGYHLHWVNDLAGRIHDAEDNDYEFVNPKEVGFDTKESKVKRLVGANEDGSALYAYLMKIRQEWYEEDQERGSALQNQVDEQIRQGKIEDTGGRYIPKNGMSIKRS